LIDIAVIIFNEIADVRFRPGLVSCFVLIARQNLVSDRISFAAVGVKVRGVWLVYKICYILVVSFKPFQKRFPWRLLAILFSW